MTEEQPAQDPRGCIAGLAYGFWRKWAVPSTGKLRGACSELQTPLLCRVRGARACVAAIRISPFLGVARLCSTPMSRAASARASSVCGTCTFISSPSKSALYGAHTHSLKRNVLRQHA